MNTSILKTHRHAYTDTLDALKAKLRLMETTFDWNTKQKKWKNEVEKRAAIYEITIVKIKIGQLNGSKS